MNRKRLLAFAIGGVFLCLLFCGIIFVISFIVSGGLEEPNGVEILIDAPLRVSENRPFTITVSVTNHSAESLFLHSIDISNHYLDGLRLEETDPAYKEAFLIPVVDFYSYTFQQPVFIDESVTVELTFVGIRTGDFSGEVDVCINNGVHCKLIPIRTIVGEF